MIMMLTLIKVSSAGDFCSAFDYAVIDSNDDYAVSVEGGSRTPFELVWRL